MALTLTELQEIKKAKLDTYLANNKAVWLASLKRAHTFLTQSVPSGTVIRPDDVFKALIPVIEANEQLQNALAIKKLKQKFWFRYFCDYVIDNLWNEI